MLSFKGKSNLHPAKTPYALKNTFEVRCKDLRGMLCTDKFASGPIGKCIQIGQDWLTPEEFELRAGSTFQYVRVNFIPGALQYHGR